MAQPASKRLVTEETIAAAGAARTAIDARVKAVGDATYGRVDESNAVAVGAPLKNALDAGLTCAVGVMSDSTAAYPNEQSETKCWPYLLGEAIAAQYPQLRVVYLPWDAQNELRFLPPRVIQAGASGERYAQFQSAGRTLGWPTLGTSAKDASREVHLTGEIDCALRIMPDSATIGTTGDQFLAGRSTYQRLQFSFRIKGTSTPANAGKLVLQLSVDGLAFTSERLSSVAVPFVQGEPIWVRFTYAPATGVTKFYTSADGYTWSQLGADNNGVVQQPFDQTAIFEIGGMGWSSATSQFLGRIYEVHIRDGINGPLVTPAVPSRWDRYPLSTEESSVTFGGSQTLYIVNGSRAGQGLAYLSDETRVKRLTPDYGQVVQVYATSHNDGTLQGDALLANWSTWATRVRARLPYVSEALTTENPALTPASFVGEHAKRTAQLAGWARRSGLGVIDTARAFRLDSRGVTALMETDGRHPNADGQALMAAVTRRALLGA